MEQFSICSNPDFINDSWLQIHKNRSWDMFSWACLSEKGVEWVITSTSLDPEMSNVSFIEPWLVS